MQGSMIFVWWAHLGIDGSTRLRKVLTVSQEANHGQHFTEYGVWGFFFSFYNCFAEYFYIASFFTLPSTAKATDLVLNKTEN